MSKKNKKTNSAHTTKKTIVTECEWSQTCPAVNKCRLGGVFTRYDTNDCVCRDYFRPQMLEGFLKHDKSNSRRRR